MLRVGIIGCGRIVQESHAKAFLAHRDRATVVALADPSPERLGAIGEALGVPAERCFADYREMLARVDLDLVDVALPHFLHEAAVLDAAAAKAHVLLEKPMATTLEEADRMLAAVRQAGVQLAVVQNYIYRPPEALAIRMVREGVIGKPFLVRSEGLGGSHYKGAVGYDPDWRTRAARSGGGCLLDNAYHNLYACRYFLQSPIRSIYARVKTYFHQIDVDDTAMLLLEHENGAVSSVQVSWAVKAGGQRVAEIHGTEGTIAFGREGKPLAIYRNASGAWEYPEVATGDGFPEFVGAYLEALANGGRPPVDGEEGRLNLRVVMAAYESGRTGQPVQL